MLMSRLRWNRPSTHEVFTSGNLRRASAQARMSMSVIVTFSAPGTESLSCWRSRTASSTRASTVTVKSGTVAFDSAMRRAMVACMRVGSRASTSGPVGCAVSGRRRSLRAVPAAAMTSSFTTRPSGPVPVTAPRSTPISSASRLASGEALISRAPWPSESGARGRSAAGAAVFLGSGAGEGGGGCSGASFPAGCSALSAFVSAFGSTFGSASGSAFGSAFFSALGFGAFGAKGAEFGSGIDFSLADRAPDQALDVLAGRYRSLLQGQAVGHRHLRAAESQDRGVEVVEAALLDARGQLSGDSISRPALFDDHRPRRAPDRFGDGFPIDGADGAKVDHLGVDVLLLQLLGRLVGKHRGA